MREGLALLGREFTEARANDRAVFSLTRFQGGTSGRSAPSSRPPRVVAWPLVGVLALGAAPAPLHLNPPPGPPMSPRRGAATRNPRNRGNLRK